MTKAQPPIHISFLLVSGFMMAAYVLAIDAFRLANWHTGKRLFQWDVRTSDNESAQANNTMIVTPTAELSSQPYPDIALVCAGFSPEQAYTKPVLSWLRSLERQHAILGGWDTGPLILAEAGLMDNQRMAVHWQTIPAVKDRYPSIEIVSDNCQISERRFTAAGGLSTFDLVIAIIEKYVGANIARMVSHSANHNSSKYLPNSFPKHISQALDLMERNIETPILIPGISKKCAISERGLIRLFKQHLRMTPGNYYQKLRLHRACDLLRQTEMSITEIASISGFNSPSRFSQAFKNYFKETPTNIRMRPR